MDKSNSIIKNKRALVATNKNYITSHNIATFSSPEETILQGEQDKSMYRIAKIKASKYYAIFATIIHDIDDEKNNFAHCNVDINPQNIKLNTIERKDLFNKLIVHVKILDTCL